MHELTYAAAVAKLAAAFCEPLPGPRAQFVLAPQPRPGWPPGFASTDVRQAAGLLLVFPFGEHAHIVLTVRGDTLRHGGQVSLPGGVIEPGESFEQAALREAHEEVGLGADGVRVLGGLTPVDILVSGFRLHPVVAATDRRPVLSAADGEVARILEVRVSDLMDPARLERVHRRRSGYSLDIPLIRLGEDEIWGATAMVLAEFLAMLGWEPVGGPVPALEPLP